MAVPNGNQQRVGGDPQATQGLNLERLNDCKGVGGYL